MKIARLSLKYKNLQGVIIDDFRAQTGPTYATTAMPVKRAAR